MLWLCIVKFAFSSLLWLSRDPGYAEKFNLLDLSFRIFYFNNRSIPLLAEFSSFLWFYLHSLDLCKSRLPLQPPIFVCYNNLIPQPYRWCGSAGFSWVRPTCRVVYIDHQERWPPPLLLPQTDLRQLVRTLHLLVWYRIRTMFSPKPVLWC